jgi:spore coat protein U-like protein
VRAVIAALLALGGAPDASAMSCGITGITGAAFGQYDPFSRDPLDTLGEIRLTCTDVQPFQLVAIELSKGSAPSFIPRTLHNGSKALAYNLYLDSGRTAVWGDGLSGTARYGPFAPPSGVAVPLPVYGRIPGSQNAPAGAYSDTVVVTLVF